MTRSECTGSHSEFTQDRPPACLLVRIFPRASFHVPLKILIVLRLAHCRLPLAAPPPDSPSYPAAAERESVRITCDPHYRLSPQGNPAPECQLGGQWTRAERYAVSPLSLNDGLRKTYGEGGVDGQWEQAQGGQWNLPIKTSLSIVPNAEGERGTFGIWENGRVCEPITCAEYPAPLNGRVHPGGTARVRSGTEVSITCNRGYMPYGVKDGAKNDPKCLDSGEFEKGIQCVAGPCPCCEESMTVGAPLEESMTVGAPLPLPLAPRLAKLSRACGLRCPVPCMWSEVPCPVLPQSAPPGQAIKCDAQGGEQPGETPFVPTQTEIRDWEDDFDHARVFDYVPNVFDHEPRPTSWDSR